AYGADVRSAPWVKGAGPLGPSGPTAQPAEQPRLESGPGPQRKLVRVPARPALTQVAAASSPALVGPSSLPLPAMLAGGVVPPVPSPGRSPLQVTVPAFGSAILTQTVDGNFNTSGSPIVGCGLTSAVNESRILKVTVSVG